METEAVIMGNLEKGISHVCFSEGGKYLAGMSMTDDHCMAVYDMSNI